MDIYEIIFYLQLALPYAVAILLGLLVSFACVAVYSRPGVAAALVVLGFMQTLLLPGFAGIPLGITVEFQDFITVLLLAAGLLRIGTRASASALPRSFWIAALAILLSFALGTLKYKTAAGVAMRPYFYAMAVALYFSTAAFDPRMQRIFARTSGVLAALLVGVAALRWGGLLDGAGDSSTGRFATLERIRAINSVQSLLVLQFALLALVGQRLTFPSAFGRITGNALLLFTLVLQHRSVWVAGMAAVFATALSGARRHFGAIAFGGVVVALLIVVLSALGIGGSLFGEVSRSAARAVQGADTAQARLDTWQFALGKWWGGGPSAWLFGLPFGTNMERVVVNSQGDAQKISFQSHSFYIQTLFSLGLVGLGSWLAFFAATGRRLLQQARSGTAGVWPSLLFSLFVSQLAYYLTYGTSYEHGLLLGVCAAVAFARPLAQAGQVAAAPGRMAPSPSGAPP